MFSLTKVTNVTYANKRFYLISFQITQLSQGKGQIVSIGKEDEIPQNYIGVSSRTSFF